MPSAILLAHIEMWVTELECEVQAFEAAVKEVEEEMEKDERLQRLERALEKAKQVEGLVHAANTTLNDAIDAARLVVENERIGNYSEAEPTALPSQANQPLQPEQPAQPTIIKAALTNPLPAGEQADLALAPLARGSVILNDRYRIVEVLQTRPRVNLYLAHRLNTTKEQEQGAATLPLVAIRELVLSGLSLNMQKRVEQAAFEEFVAPGMFGSPRLPGVGDRISIEHERHYLVMQLRPVRNERQNGHVMAVPLVELLLKNQQWPTWLGVETALEWGVQLCRIVARLHRMGVMLGGLDPAMILVDSGGPAAWAPVLLVSWPPARQFWSDEASRAYYEQIFPIAINSTENSFAAPETLSGHVDERSDVYSLGALLYLFFTRYAPVAASFRLPDEQQPAQGANGHLAPEGAFASPGGMALVPPHLFNGSITSELEAVLLRALAMRPDERFPTVFALVEALEAVDAARLTPTIEQNRRMRQDSKVTKALWGLRKHP